MEPPQHVEKYTRMPSVPVTLLASLPGRHTEAEIVRIATNEVLIRNTNLEAVVERGICVGMFETSRFHETAVELVYGLSFGRKLDLAQKMLQELDAEDSVEIIQTIKAHNTPRNRIAHRHDAEYVAEGKLKVIQRRASGGNVGPAKFDVYELGWLDDLFFAARAASERVAEMIYPEAAVDALSHWGESRDIDAADEDGGNSVRS